MKALSDAKAMVYVDMVALSSFLFTRGHVTTLASGKMLAPLQKQKLFINVR